jgi:delta24-sterol reductase
LFAVPVSFIYDKIRKTSNLCYRLFLASPKKHDQRVDQISQLVKEASTSGKKMVTARAPWKTMSNRVADYKKDCIQIPLNLHDILELNEEALTIRVEPMVNMADITRYLVPKGYALAVQVEMDDLTVGGLCMGVGIEASSHRYGFLYETITEFELVIANGNVIKASEKEHKELFRSLPWSHGTLGFLVGVTLKIVKIKPYIKLTYHPFHSLEELSAAFKKYTEEGPLPTFLEGLQFSKEEGVLMTGNFDDGASMTRLNKINNYYKPWFYEHVKSFLSTGKGVEWIPVRAYFHRHTPSVFFQLKDLIPFANQAWYRYLFSWLGAPKVSLMKFSMTKELRKRAFANRVAQDILIPVEDMEEAIRMVDTDYNIYPVWLCPVKLVDYGDQQGVIPRPKNKKVGKNFGMYIDIGIYGIPTAVKNQRKWSSAYHGRKLEKFNIDKGGFQMLYADIFMTRKEFEHMFNLNLYKKVRKDYGADKVFPDIYTKVIPERWLVDLDKLAEKYP